MIAHDKRDKLSNAVRGRLPASAFCVILKTVAPLWIHVPANAARSDVQTFGYPIAAQHTSLLPDSLFSAFRVGDHRIRLNSVMSLATVKTQLGPAPIARRASADAPEHVLCYLTTDSPARRLRVIAYPEPSEIVGVNFTSLDSTAAADAKCRPLGLPARSVGITNGLGLGADTASVRQLLGAPTIRQSSKWLYESTRDTVIRSRVTHQPVSYDIGGEIELLFRHGMIVEMHISQSRSG